MVFLLAKVLSYAFLLDNNTSRTILPQIEHEVEEWNSCKPASFDPIRFVPRTRQANQAFPEIWLLSPFHGESILLTFTLPPKNLSNAQEVVALQYYHIAKLVLAVTTRQPQVSGYENLRQGRKIEVMTDTLTFNSRIFLT